MSEKRTTHVFETYSLNVEITEYPHKGTDEININIDPQDPIDSVSIFGNPKEDQTFFIRVDESCIWIKAPKLFDMIVNALDKYKKTWGNYFSDSSEQSKIGEDE